MEGEATSELSLKPIIVSITELPGLGSSGSKRSLQRSYATRQFIPYAFVSA